MKNFTTGKMVMAYPAHIDIIQNPQLSDFVYKSIKRYLNCEWGDPETIQNEKNWDAYQWNNGEIRATYQCHDPEYTIEILTLADHSYTIISNPNHHE